MYVLNDFECVRNIPQLPIFLNKMCASCRLVHTWFLKNRFCAEVCMHACVCVCVCVSASEVINNHDMDSYDWFNKATAFIQQLKSLLAVGVPLELKCFIETTLVRVNYHCINSYFHPYKQLHTSNKMECFSYKDRCGGHGQNFSPFNIWLCIHIW